MRKLFSVITLFSMSFVLGGATAEDVGKARFDFALKLIEARNANLTCHLNAFQGEIIDLVTQANSDSGENYNQGLGNFLRKIPAGSDILLNFRFRLASQKAALSQIQNDNILDSFIEGTRYFSRSSGVYGPAVTLDLLAHGDALVKQNIFIQGQVQTVTKKGTWKTRIEFEPRGERYHFIELNVQGKKSLYSIEVQPNTTEYILKNSQSDESANDYMFFTSPDDCSA